MRKFRKDLRTEEKTPKGYAAPGVLAYRPNALKLAIKKRLKNGKS